MLIFARVRLLSLLWRICVIFYLFCVFFLPSKLTLNCQTVIFLYSTRNKKAVSIHEHCCCIFIDTSYFMFRFEESRRMDTERNADKRSFVEAKKPNLKNKLWNASNDSSQLGSRHLTKIQLPAAGSTTCFILERSSDRNKGRFWTSISFNQIKNVMCHTIEITK